MNPPGEWKQRTDTDWVFVRNGYAVYGEYDPQPTQFH
jgi:hypothetical protein